MIGYEFDYGDPDPADVAADRAPRGVSCTPSCTGCSSPECGYCDAKREALIERRLAAVYEGDSDELIAAMRSDEVLAVIVQDLAKKLRDRLAFKERQFVFDDRGLGAEMRSFAIRLTGAATNSVYDAVNENKDWSRGFDRRAA